MRNKAFQLIRNILMEKRKEFIMILSSYIIFYMFLTGMIQYVNYDLSYAISYFPYVSLSNLGIAIALSNHWLVVIYYSNLIVMITTGFLITLNILLLIYSIKNTLEINKKEKITSRSSSWFAAIPVILLHVVCCGGILILLFINVAGTAIISIISFLIQYNFQISLIFIAILLLTNYLTLRRLLLKNGKN